MTRTPSFNDEQFQKLLMAQYGVITRQQALECGLTPKAIDYRMRPDGPWQRLLPHTLLTHTGPVTPDQKAAAALLYAGPRSLISGPVAVRRHHLACAGPDAIDVLVPVTSQVHGTRFVQVHRSRHMPTRCYYTRTIRFAVQARAVADAARWLNRFGEVRAVVCEALQHNACTLEELASELHAGWLPHSKLLRRALAEVGAGTRSVAEAKFRKLLLRSDLPEPMFNAQLFDMKGQFIAMVDAWWGEEGVAAEIDSHAYHLKAADQDATTSRHSKLTARGILLHHFPPSRMSEDWPGILSEIRESIDQGRRRPRVPILTVPLAA